MKLFIALSIFVMSCGPTCDPIALGPTSSGGSSGYGPGDSDPQTRVSYYGKVVDESTGQFVYSARIYLNSADSQVTGSVYPGGYEFKFWSSRIPREVKIKVTHPDYQPDSLMHTVTQAPVSRRHDFRLKRR